MNDEQDNPGASTEGKEAASDFDAAYFPTSAQPVFLKVGIMIAGIIVLCVMVYVTSSHEEKPAEKKAAEGQPLLEEEEE